jgi:hypothetical protein
MQTRRKKSGTTLGEPLLSFKGSWIPQGVICGRYTGGSSAEFVQAFSVDSKEGDYRAPQQGSSAS